jgi:hypothetical protein
VKSKIVDQQQQRLMADYAQAARFFADTVERLQEHASNAEAFIEALEATGTAHRACERSRVLLKKYLETGMRRAQ